MSLFRKIAPLAVAAGVVVLGAGLPTRAASTAKATRYVHLLAHRGPTAVAPGTVQANAVDPSTYPLPAPFTLNPAAVRVLDAGVRRQGARPPRLTARLIRQLQSLAPEAVMAQRDFILERFRQLSTQPRRNGYAFGGFFPPGGTTFIPTRAVNIFTYFPIFRI